MKPNLTSRTPHHRRRNTWLLICLLALMFSPAQAHASIFKGETLDKVADVLTWVVLIIAPIIGIGVFLIIHILPEKIAEKREHPQTKAIQCLCLLSLVFGGVLWPLAWLWAYTRPVLHKLAYGTDRLAHRQDEEEEELKHLRERIVKLEVKHAAGDER
jgi:CBS domain containing-hemolysin-like protein